MKRIFILLVVAIATAISVNGQTPAQTLITVTDEVSFINALKNNTLIHLPEGTKLNLTKVLDKIKQFTSKGRIYGEFNESLLNSTQTILLNESVYDGRQLTILNLDNVTIHGDGDCHIVVDPAYAYVLNFINCKNIKLENLIMGHTVEGFCTGGVVGMGLCKDMVIDGCELYGCGAYGLIADNTHGITMRNSIIRDCSYGIMELYGCSYVSFLKCDFFRNREFSMISTDTYCKYIMFEACRFYENKGVLFDLKSTIHLKACGIVHNELETIGNFKQYVKQVDEYSTIIIADY